MADNIIEFIKELRHNMIHPVASKKPTTSFTDMYDFGEDGKQSTFSYLFVDSGAEKFIGSGLIKFSVISSNTNGSEIPIGDSNDEIIQLKRVGTKLQIRRQSGIDSDGILYIYLLLKI